MKRLLHLLWIGIVTGIAFGFVLKGLQAMTGKKVYTLLLNVDYIPWFRDRVFNELEEFSFHVIISVIVVFVFYWLLKKMRLSHKIIPYMFVNGLIGAMMFTTTSFSMKTPDVLDGEAFGLWLIAHVIYGFFVGICIQSTLEKEER